MSSCGLSSDLLLLYHTWGYFVKYFIAIVVKFLYTIRIHTRAHAYACMREDMYENKTGNCTGNTECNTSVLHNTTRKCNTMQHRICKCPSDTVRHVLHNATLVIRSVMCCIPEHWKCNTYTSVRFRHGLSVLHWKYNTMQQRGRRHRGRRCSCFYPPKGGLNNHNTTPVETSAGNTTGIKIY